MYLIRYILESGEHVDSYEADINKVKTKVDQSKLNVVVLDLNNPVGYGFKIVLSKP